MQPLQGFLQAAAVGIELAHFVEDVLRILRTALLPQHFAQMRADLHIR